MVFIGDNFVFLVGMRLDKGDIVLSLGISDIFMLCFKIFKFVLEGYIFVNLIEGIVYLI